MRTIIDLSCLVIGYYDLYNTNYLDANRTYTYYRFYDSVDQDMYIPLERSTSNYNYGYLANIIEIEPSHNYIYRKDYKDIVLTSAIIIIGIVCLINLITSIIRKGGLLSGLL